MLPQVSRPELQRAIYASIEEYARQRQLARDRNVAHANSPRGLCLVQQPTPERTRMASELDQISEVDHSGFPAGFPANGQYYNGELSAAFQASNNANATADSAYFSTNTFTRDSALALDNCMGQLCTGLPSDAGFSWPFNQNGSVSLDDFQPYPGAEDIMPERLEEVPDQ